MTRIFDALRKARTHAQPAPPPHAPAALPMPAPAPAPRPPAPYGAPQAHGAAGLAAPARTDLPLPALAFLETRPPMGDDVLREMGTLRLHLEAALTERVPRRVMLVGLQGHEGVTTVAAQFALSLARDETIRVLLVDAHGRRAALSAAAEHPETRPGAASPERAAEPGDDRGALSRLRVLPLPVAYRSAGGVPAHGMRQLLDSVEAAFDWIILDGPPVLESPVAATLAALADGALLVVQAGRTKRPVLGRAVDLLRRAGARVLGTVLNRRRLEIPGFIYRRI